MHFILSGTSCSKWAQELSSLSSIPVADSYFQTFADGEIKVDISSPLKDSHIYLLQSTSPPVNQNYMELFLLLDVLKREKVKKITLIMPYYGYSRQDRQTQSGEPVSAQCIAQILQNLGVDEAFFLDIHSVQILDFFKIPVQNISAIPFMAQEWLKTFPEKKPVCISPDAGGRKRAENFAQIIGAPTAWVQKERSQVNQAQALDLHGEVQGKDICILDDMIDTAGTLCTSVDKLIENGAKDVFVIATHGLFSGEALNRIEKSPIREVWITDSIKPKPQVLQTNKIKVIPSVKIFKDIFTDIS